jgi:hypothetical protein
VEIIKLPYTKFETNEWVNGECERTLQTKTMDEKTLLKESCLSEEEIYKYLNFKHSPIFCGYAIHITKLEIFYKPKEIKEFRKPSTFSLEQLREIGLPYTKEMYKDMATKGKWFLTRVPQSWCYVEV